MPKYDLVRRALEAGDAKELAQIVCCSHWPKVRRDAEEALLTFDTDEVVAAILHLAGKEEVSANQAVAAEAAALIADIGPRAVELMIRALEDQNVGGFAARTLVTLADWSAVEEHPMAVAALEHAAAAGERSLRLAVGQAVGKAKSKNWSSEILRRLSCDSDPGVREAAAEALGNNDAEHSLQQLVTLVSDEETAVRLAATSALQPRGGYRPDPAMIHLDQIRLRGLATALNDSDERIREFAASFLGEFSAEKTTADILVASAARALASAAGDPVFPVRRAAIAALSRVGGPVAAARLVTAVSQDSTMRAEAALALIRLPDADEAARLAIAALRDADSDVRIAVAEAIGTDAAGGTEEERRRSFGVSRTGRLLSNTTFSGVVFEAKLRDLVIVLSRLTTDVDEQVRIAASAALAAISARLQRKREEATKEACREEASASSPKSVPLSSAESVGPTPESTPGDEDVRFTALHPTTIYRDKWYTLLVYLHLDRAARSVRQDSLARLAGAKMEYWPGAGRAHTPLERGAPVRIVPRLTDTRFNPAHIDLTWLEDWHVAEFRMQAISRSGPIQARQLLVEGTIEFRVGPLLIGEVAIWAVVAGDGAPDSGASVAVSAETKGKMYSAIFPSYAHEDADFVDKLEHAYSLLNLRYLRDVKELRAGEEWKPRLRTMIEEADVFQLCWSVAAERSPDVQNEWRHALGLARSGFIKPIYWQTPITKPPKELDHLHFQYWDPS